MIKSTESAIFFCSLLIIEIQVVNFTQNVSVLLYVFYAEYCAVSL